MMIVRGSIWSADFMVGPGGPGGVKLPCARTCPGSDRPAARVRTSRGDNVFMDFADVLFEIGPVNPASSWVRRARAIFFKKSQNHFSPQKIRPLNRERLPFKEPAATGSSAALFVRSDAGMKTQKTCCGSTDRANPPRVSPLFHSLGIDHGSAPETLNVADYRGMPPFSPRPYCTSAAMCPASSIFSSAPPAIPSCRK